MSHDSWMTDEDFKNLEHTVERHHGEFDLMVKRIEELENDLKIVDRYKRITSSTRSSIQQAELT
jgi:hypothetical protein